MARTLTIKTASGRPIHSSTEQSKRKKLTPSATHRRFKNGGKLKKK